MAYANDNSHYALNNCDTNIQGKIDPSVGFEEQDRKDLQNEQLQFAYGGDELLECHIDSACIKK